MKTPEQMAEEHANIRCPEQGPEFIVWCMCRDDFLAGYQAAKDQVADTGKVMHQWISVKERLPDNGDCVLVYRNNIAEISIALALFDYWQIWGVTHWMPLPEAPKEEA